MKQTSAWTPNVMLRLVLRLLPFALLFLQRVRWRCYVRLLAPGSALAQPPPPPPPFLTALAAAALLPATVLEHVRLVLVSATQVFPAHFLSGFALSCFTACSAGSCLSSAPSSSRFRVLLKAACAELLDASSATHNRCFPHTRFIIWILSATNNTLACDLRAESRYRQTSLSARVLVGIFRVYDVTHDDGTHTVRSLHVRVFKHAFTKRMSRWSDIC